jgi:hypothetical protein
MRGMHSIYVGERHFKIEKISGGGGGRMSRRFTRIDNMAGMMEDVKWIGVTKYGKSLSRLIWKMLGCVLMAFMMTLPILVLSAKERCQEDLDLYQYNPLNETSPTLEDEDLAEWCGRFSTGGIDLSKIGHPCICPSNSHMCNPMLDKATYMEARDAWCDAFGTSDESKWIDFAALSEDDTFRPCECLTSLEQHMPNWTLCANLMTILLVIMWPFTVLVWLLYTYIWFVGAQPSSNP